MIDNDEQKPQIESLDEPNASSAIEGYDADQMISCAKCKRQNAPNRLDCMYCGVRLELTDKQAQTVKPKLRKADHWKNAINVIFISKHPRWDESNLDEVAKMTRLDAESLKLLCDSNKVAPLARSEQVEEIEVVQKRLLELGLQTRSVEDSEFSLETAQRRLRRISFDGDVFELELFNGGELVEIDPSNICNVVMGALFERRVESSEKHSRRKENKILETAEMSVDERLIDIYTDGDKVGYRIMANGFDFSLLRGQKSMVADENMLLLIRKLCELAPNAEYDDDYLRLRGVLSIVWDVEEQTDSMGVKRKGFGGYRRETVTTTNNLSQFSKYSRLQLLANEIKE